MQPISSARTSRVTEAECGVRTTLSRARKRGSSRRLAGEDVEPRARDRAGLQGAEKRRLVDHRSARDVDQEPVAPELFQNRRVAQMVRLGAASAGEHQDVGSLGQLRDAGREGVIHVVPPRAARIGHRKADPLRAPGDGAPDPPEADNADRLVPQAARRRDAGRSPGPGAHEAVRLHDAAGNSVDQADGEIGHVLREDIGRHRDLDAARGCRLEVEQVQADTLGQYQLERGEACHLLLGEAVHGRRHGDPHIDRGRLTLEPFPRLDPMALAERGRQISGQRREGRNTLCQRAHQKATISQPAKSIRLDIWSFWVWQPLERVGSGSGLK